MYQTIWLDISSGKDKELFPVVLEKLRKFKGEGGFDYGEAGIIFEECDIFILVDQEDAGALLDFVLRELSPLEGVMEMRMGHLMKVSAPPKPLAEEPADPGSRLGTDITPETRGKGPSFFLIFLDTLPSDHRTIYEALGEMNDPRMRYHAYCLDSYKEDIMVCMVMEAIEQAKYHIITKLRSIQGIRDTRTFVVNNVEFL